jgi:hypothetical protein
MHTQSHIVRRLPVHLPLQQPVHFESGHEQEALASHQTTALIAWFSLNATNPSANQYLYTDIPNHFVYHRTKEWKPRKRGGDKVIARMYTVSPRDTEKFALRTLLLHIPGAKSFTDLKTLDGAVAPTFQDACKLRNLLTDDTQWEQTLNEAATFQMPFQMRKLFAVICCYGQPTTPLELWHKFKQDLTEDYTRLYDNSTADNLALQDIQHVLAESGRSLLIPSTTMTQPYVYFSQIPNLGEGGKRNLICFGLLNNIDDKSRPIKKTYRLCHLSLF